MEKVECPFLLHLFIYLHHPWLVPWRELKSKSIVMQIKSRTADAGISMAHKWCLHSLFHRMDSECMARRGRQVACWVVWPDREHKLRFSAHINSAAAAAAGSITSPLYVIDGNLTHATTEGDKQ